MEVPVTSAALSVPPFTLFGGISSEAWRWDWPAVAPAQPRTVR